MHTLKLITPGVVPYGLALAMQLELRQQIAELPPHEQDTGYLLCLQHPPVITLGKRGLPSALLNPTTLAQRGIEVYKIDRGGEATYHEPGQLVVYPILPLRSMNLGVVDLIRNMAECMASCVRPFGADVSYDKDVPGLWTAPDANLPTRKMASVGMRVSRGVTTHGIAINLTNDMQGFGLIVPCGMPGTPFCNLLNFMENPPTQKEKQDALVERILQDFVKAFGDYLGVRPTPSKLDWEEVTPIDPMPLTDVTPMM